MTEKIMTNRFVRADNKQEVYLDMTYSEWFDRVFSDGCSMRWCILLDDGTKAYDHGIVRKKSMQTAGNYPMASSALGVHPDEIPHRIKFDKAKGVPTEYDSDGDPIMRDAKHRRDYCRAHGVHDRNGGFSDPVPD